MTDFTSYREAEVGKKLDMMDNLILDVMLTGPTGVGKSTTLNAIFSRTAAKVGYGTEPETMDIESYMLNQRLRIWDTPGLGDGVERDRYHREKLVSLLRKTYHRGSQPYGYIDMAVIIEDASSRDRGTADVLLNEVILPNIQSDRVLVIINQADCAMKGRHWDQHSCKPDEELEAWLNEKAYSIQRRVRESHGILIPKPVCYSAKYGWNLQAVMDFIIDHIKTVRRPMTNMARLPCQIPFSF